MLVMFSGIIEEVGIVKDTKFTNGILEINVSSCKLIKELEEGDSIAVNGCCLTVTSVFQDCFSVQVTNETLSKTNLQKLTTGSNVNLEPSLRLGDRISGHLVTGHIDNIGEVEKITSSGENKTVSILYPKELGNYIAPKGSITVNGVSLTVIDSLNGKFSFVLIPFTNANTNLGLIKIGDLVNLEIDLISRYLVNYIGNNYQLQNK